MRRHFIQTTDFLHVIAALTLLVALGTLSSCTRDVSEEEPWQLMEVGERDMRGSNAMDASDDGGTSGDMSAPVDAAPPTPPIAKDMARDLQEVDMAPAPLPLATRDACGEPGGGQCQVVDVDALGDCQQPLGVAFDGSRCVEVIGCPCEGDAACPMFFEDELSCARACERDGYCQGERLKEHLEDARLCEDVYCGDTLAVCVDASEDPTKTFEALLGESETFGDVRCSPGPGSRGLCSFAAYSECPEGSWCCESYVGGGFLERERARPLCTISLLEGVRTVGCYMLE